MFQSSYERKDQYVEIKLSQVFNFIPYIKRINEDIILECLSDIDNKQKKIVYEKTLRLIKKSGYADFFMDGEMVDIKEMYGEELVWRTEKKLDFDLFDHKTYNFSKKIKINFNGLIILMIMLSTYEFTKENTLFKEYLKKKYKCNNVNYDVIEVMNTVIELVEAPKDYENYYASENYSKENKKELLNYINSKNVEVILKENESISALPLNFNPLLYFFIDFLFFIYDKKNFIQFWKGEFNPFVQFIETEVKEFLEETKSDNDIINDIDEKKGREYIKKIINSVEESNSRWGILKFIKDYKKLNKEGFDLLWSGALETFHQENTIWSREFYVIFFEKITKMPFSEMYKEETEKLWKKNLEIIFEFMIEYAITTDKAEGINKYSFHKTINEDVNQLLKELKNYEGNLIF